MPGHKKVVKMKLYQLLSSLLVFRLCDADCTCGGTKFNTMTLKPNIRPFALDVRLNCAHCIPPDLIIVDDSLVCDHKCLVYDCHIIKSLLEMEFAQTSVAIKSPTFWLFCIAGMFLEWLQEVANVENRNFHVVKAHL